MIDDFGVEDVEGRENEATIPPVHEEPLDTIPTLNEVLTNMQAEVVDAEPVVREVEDKGTPVEGDENSGKIPQYALDELLCEAGYVGAPVQWNTFDSNVKTEHVYHHSEDREPYGSLNVDETPRGRTVKVELKNVTSDNLGVALALYASLESLGAEELEAAKEEIGE